MPPSRHEAAFALAVWEGEGGRLRATPREPAHSATAVVATSHSRRRLLDAFGRLDARIAEALGRLIAQRNAR